MLSFLNRLTGSAALSVYVLWAFVVFAVVFAKDALAADNVTHVFVLIYLFLSLLLFSRIKDIRNRLGLGPKAAFVILSTISAAFVETFYMISKPLDPSLVVTLQMPASQIARNWAIDIILTTPFYAVLFLVVWWLINKYDYKTWQFVIFVSLGQALGDGSAFFLLNPGALLLLPYIMSNYHAMNTAPFLLVRKETKPRSTSRIKLIVPLVLIPIVYVLGGLAIKTAAAFLGLF